MNAGRTAVGWMWIATVVVVTAVPFVAGKAYELSTQDPFDSGAYVYSAQRLLSGARLGVDEKPTALPGTLLVNLLGVWLGGFNEIGPKLVQALLQLIALGFMLVTLRRLWGRLAAGVGVVLTATYLSAPVIAKFGNVKEQYMIACMVVGVCCVILDHLGGSRWWLAVAGAALAWAPLFKQTGISAIVAVGVFLVAQVALGRRGWRRVAHDLLVLLGGAAASLLPVLVWLALAGAPLVHWPYSTFVRAVLPAGGDRVGSYLAESRKMMPAASLAPIVLRYLKVLSLPVLLAGVSALLALWRWIRDRRATAAAPDVGVVLLLAVWWAADMALVWVSPRSYEQYYLPLTASGSMLGAWVVAEIGRRAVAGGPGWRLAATAMAVIAAVLLAPIVIGLSHSPHSGSAYEDRRRGYAQSVRQTLNRLEHGTTYPWEQAGDDIREHTRPSDTIYVWGWYPGLYVRAQRFSPTPTSCLGSMHTLPPEQLADRVTGILESFHAQPPEVIVDSRKRHFPWDRPPLELWPRTRRGYLPTHTETVQLFDRRYAGWLAERFGEAEAARFAAMTPLRGYVMRHYTIVAEYGELVVFRRRPPHAPPTRRG
jgi:hypothetical protein